MPMTGMGSAAGDLGSQVERQLHQHHHGSTNVGQFRGMPASSNAAPASFLAALDAPATQCMDRLRRQAQVRAHRHAPLAQQAHREAPSSRRPRA